MWCNYVNIYSFRDLQHRVVLDVSFCSVKKEVSDSSISIESYLQIRLKDTLKSSNISSIHLRISELSYLIKALKKKILRASRSIQAKEPIQSDYKIKIAKKIDVSPKFLDISILIEEGRLVMDISIYKDLYDQTVKILKVRLQQSSIDVFIETLESIYNSFPQLMASTAMILSNNELLKKLDSLNLTKKSISSSYENNKKSIYIEKDNDKYNDNNTISDDIYEYEYYNDKEVEL